jgi:DNA-binding transcriptional regulator YiaG
MASIHEAMSDLYEIGGIDPPTMARFDAMCLTDAASPVEQAAKQSSTNPERTK